MTLTLDEQTRLEKVILETIAGNPELQDAILRIAFRESVDGGLNCSNCRLEGTSGIAPDDGCPVYLSRRRPDFACKAFQRKESET